MIKSLLGRLSFIDLDKSIWTITSIRFLGMFAFAVYGPFFMLYLNKQGGLTMTMAGTITSLSAFAFAISQMFGGIITDRFGRRRSLLAFICLEIIFCVAMAVMVYTSVSIWIISATYIIEGLVLGMKQPVTFAIIADIAPKHRLTEAYGLAQIVANIGWIFGPLVGGFLFSSVSYAYPFAIGALTNIGCLVLTLTMLKETFAGTKHKLNLASAFAIKADKALLTYIGLNLLVILVYSQIANTYSVFTVNVLKFSTAQFGMLLTINATLAVIFQYPITRNVELRLGDKNALFLGSILFGIGYLSMGWITGFGWSIVAIAIITAGELFFVPSSSSIVGKLAAPEHRGRYMGLLGAGSGLGVAIGPIMGGALFDVSQGSPLFMWGIFASIALVASLGFLRWFAAYKNRLR